MGRVRGVVLDPELIDAEPLGEPIGAHQRGEAGLERGPGRGRALAEGKEVRVAPDPAAARLDASLYLAGIKGREVVRDLEWAEAVLADVAGVELVRGAALLAPQLAGAGAGGRVFARFACAHEKNLCLV
jgi:hypothetical protein